MITVPGVHSQRLLRGFTLLEVLVVIAILALVAGIAFPRLDRIFENAQFASARSMVQGAARAARAEALRTDSPVTLDASSDGRYLFANGRLIGKLPISIRVRATKDRPRFFGDGSAIGGALEIASAHRRSELEVTDGTGIVRWLS